MQTSFGYDGPLFRMPHINKWLWVVFKKQNKNFIQTVTLAGVTARGGLVVIIIWFDLICFLRTRVKSDEQPAYYTDENDIYGTYERGWDGEGD